MESYSFIIYECSSEIHIRKNWGITSPEWQFQWEVKKNSNRQPISHTSKIWIEPQLSQQGLPLPELVRGNSGYWKKFLLHFHNSAFSCTICICKHLLENPVGKRETLYYHSSKLFFSHFALWLSSQFYYMFFEKGSGIWSDLEFMTNLPTGGIRFCSYKCIHSSHKQRWNSSIYFFVPFVSPNIFYQTSHFFTDVWLNIFNS